jgi:hypothetical protein
MISRQEAPFDRTDTTNDPWSALAAPLASASVAWRQDGRPIERDGSFFARFVAYVEANTVRERLDSVVPGEWNLTMELLPQAAADDADAAEPNRCAFKARLQILGVVREDVGSGRDYKQAATDAFKRAAVRFGIGHELYQLGANWVELDGGGKGARPVEDPQTAHERRTLPSSTDESAAGGPALSLDRGAESPDVPPCPVCAGRMWDNRLNKRNPRAPDFKCRDRRCEGVVWHARAQAV